MKRPDIKLIDNYFNGECPQESIAEVQQWLQTEDGQEHISTDMDLIIEDSIPDYNIEIPSSDILKNIRGLLKINTLIFR